MWNNNFSYSFLSIKKMFFLIGILMREIKFQTRNCGANLTPVQVKLGEGGLGGPRKEDVHWLDWHQLKVSVYCILS